MEIVRKEPSAKGAAEKFTGDVWFDTLALGNGPSRLRINIGHFTPGTRTFWHSHAVGQTLHVTDGVGLVQARGGEVVEIHPGDTVHTPPGQWHWHGAAPDRFMNQLAMWETLGEGAGPDIEWGDPVTDEEYGGQ